MEQTHRVAILGSGSWGTALATILPAESPITLWSRDPQQAQSIYTHRENLRYLPSVHLPANIHPTADLQEALDDADLVIFAVPSAGLREIAQAVRGIPCGDYTVLSATKGLEESTGLRMSEILRESLNCKQEPLVLSGPNLALEVANRIPTATVVAGSDPDQTKRIQELFNRSFFRVYTSSDVIGVELAGAMKNVIAIAAGISDGMGFGDNSRAAMMTRGLAEITRLGDRMGAQTNTFLGLAGVGDLIATGNSRLSRNYRVGFSLGQGKSLDAAVSEIGQVAEGVPTTRAIHLVATKLKVEMPICSALYTALFENVSVREAISSLMNRPPRTEIDI
ncbi:MAG: NAD(P)H-dependent glycerol-3-phosphate dehydrogenase [Chthonomonadales bacterium]